MKNIGYGGILYILDKIIFKLNLNVKQGEGLYEYYFKCTKCCIKLSF